MAFGRNRDFRSYCVESQCCADWGFASEHGTHRSTRHEHFDAPPATISVLSVTLKLDLWLGSTTVRTGSSPEASGRSGGVSCG